MALRADHAGEGACYSSNEGRRHTAATLLYFAFQTMECAKLIQNIDRLLKIAEEADSISPSDVESDVVRFRGLRAQQGLLMNHYVDNMIIVAAYENFLKGLLLTHGYVIHHLDKNIMENLQLVKEQKQRPIKISELPEHGGGNIGVDNYSKGYTSLLGRTLPISILLKPRYSKALQLLGQIIKALTYCIEERNRTHFLAFILYHVHRQVFEDYKSLHAYLTNEYRKAKELLKSQKSY